MIRDTFYNNIDHIVWLWKGVFKNKLYNIYHIVWLWKGVFKKSLTIFTT